MRVAIVGSGPVGLVCAHLLGLQQVSSVLLEKQSALASHPSAHFIHSSSVEVLKSLGVLEAIQREMPPRLHWRHFNYCQSVTGKVYRKHDHFASAEFYRNRELSACDPIHYPQSKLVKLLAGRLPSTCELKLSSEVVRVEQSSAGVSLWTTSGEEVKADYVLACDGAHSSIRRLLGIPMVGTPTLQHFLNVHFTSRELGQLCLANPAMLYFIYNARTVAVLVMHNAAEGDFVMQVPYLPPLQEFGNYTQKDYFDFIEAAAGKKVGDAVINSVRPWRMSAEHAAVLRRGRVFLVGDSAHKLPPAGGFGMNLGIGDANNICWKLGLPQTLDSYEQERLPRIQNIVTLSRRNYEKTVSIAKMFNLDVSMAQDFERVCEWLPLGKHVFAAGLQVGRFLISERRAQEYLATDRNLLDLIYPEADLQSTYSTGFFREHGGSLGPHTLVKHQGEELYARELPGRLLRDTGKVHFVHGKGKGEVEVPEGVQVHTVDVGTEKSFVLRPDAVLFSKAGT